MQWISLLLPPDLDAWKAGYLANVKTEAQLDLVAARAWANFQDYLATAEQLTEDDFRAYIRELVWERTYEGWNRRREAIRQQLLTDTAIDFDYLRDNVTDWRPIDFDIDVAAEHPVSGHWLALKALPISTRQSGGPGAPGRLADLHEKHRMFEDRWGMALVIYYDQRPDQAALNAEQVGRVQDAWADVGNLTP